MDRFKPEPQYSNAVTLTVAPKSCPFGELDTVGEGVAGTRKGAMLV